LVKLRLKRIGKSKQPYYRIVAAHVSVARNGRALAEVGLYDPMHASVKIDEERAIEWLNKGAQMSETVADLFHSQGILARWKGEEGRVRDDALTGDKPKRRRKEAAAAPAEPAEQEEAAPAEQAATEPAEQAEQEKA
jgi:small subunit ribosomal protein S16